MSNQINLSIEELTKISMMASSVSYNGQSFESLKEGVLIGLEVLSKKPLSFLEIAQFTLNFHMNKSPEEAAIINQYREIYVDKILNSMLVDEDYIESEGDYQKYMEVTNNKLLDAVISYSKMNGINLSGAVSITVENYLLHLESGNHYCIKLF